MWSRWNDIDRMFTAMNLLQSRLNRIFPELDRFRAIPAGWTATESGPRTNLYDNGDSFVIKMEVPGITREELNIKTQGNYLEISGSRKADAPGGYTAHRVERGSTSFSRSFTLPSDVNPDKAEALLQNGVLTLNLPKAEAAKPKQITIN